MTKERTKKDDTTESENALALLTIGELDTTVPNIVHELEDVKMFIRANRRKVNELIQKHNLLVKMLIKQAR